MTPEQRAAHQRQPAGRVYVRDDPMTLDERRAEEQRRRCQSWRRRQQPAREVPPIDVLLAWYRP